MSATGHRGRRWLTPALVAASTLLACVQAAEADAYEIVASGGWTGVGWRAFAVDADTGADVRITMTGHFDRAPARMLVIFYDQAWNVKFSSVWSFPARVGDGFRAAAELPTGESWELSAWSDPTAYPSGGQMAVTLTDTSGPVGIMAWAAGNIADAAFQIGVTSGGALSGMTAGQDVVHLSARDFASTAEAAAATAGIGGRVNVGGRHVDAPANNNLIGHFYRDPFPTSPGTDALLIKSGLRISPCPCPFYSRSGPDSLGPGTHEFLLNGAAPTVGFQGEITLAYADVEFPS